MVVLVPYQIDHTVTSAGRTIGGTKKKITFKVGIANPDALERGEKGTECRGVEHEIVFVWSLKSGKRQVIVNNRMVHRSETGMNGWTADRTFQFRFEVPSSHNGQPVLCHLVSGNTANNNNNGGETRPVDLLINGMSYFDTCQIFQLGTPAMHAWHLRHPGAPPMPGPAGNPTVGSSEDPYSRGYFSPLEKNNNTSKRRGLLKAFSTRSMSADHSTDSNALTVSQQPNPYSNYSLPPGTGPTPTMAPRHHSMPPVYMHQQQQQQYAPAPPMGTPTQQRPTWESQRSFGSLPASPAAVNNGGPTTPTGGYYGRSPSFATPAGM